jgi:hypothetical protein
VVQQSCYDGCFGLMVLDDSTDDQDGGALDEEVIKDVTLLDDEADGRSGEDNVRCAMA